MSTRAKRTRIDIYPENELRLRALAIQTRAQLSVLVNHALEYAIAHTPEVFPWLSTSSPTSISPKKPASKG